MRVSHSALYDSFLQNINNSAHELQELNQQASSQKKVNKPSDDPVGTSRILGYRDSLDALDQYQSNIDTAEGWLDLADETLMQASDLLTRAKELAEQGATGTLSEDQREMLAKEVRQVLDQMINLGNTRYEGKSIFGGHKTDETAFERTLWVTELQGLDEEDVRSVEGSLDESILVEFEPEDGSGTVGDEDISYRYSVDGGETWEEDELASGETVMELEEGVTVELESGVDVYGPDPGNDEEQTRFIVRPTAEYQGDDMDREQHDISLYAEDLDEEDVSATGNFDRNVTVRIDDVDNEDEIQYSYSHDGGSTWEEGNVTHIEDDSARFVLPEGRMDIDLDDNNNLDFEDLEGDQITIRPNRAAIDFEISPGDNIQVNNVGKDVFGGIYQKPDGEYVKDPPGPENIFETLGELVGHLETNNEEGIQQSLENIDQAQKHLNKQMADVGARRNRLEVAETVISGLELNEQERKSEIEDVDMAELMTKLSSQQMSYEAVLRSSSMIMQMSLVDYL